MKHAWVLATELCISPSSHHRVRCRDWQEEHLILGSLTPHWKQRCASIHWKGEMKNHTIFFSLYIQNDIMATTESLALKVTGWCFESNGVILSALASCQVHPAHTVTEFSDLHILYLQIQGFGILALSVPTHAHKHTPGTRGLDFSSFQGEVPFRAYEC